MDRKIYIDFGKHRGEKWKEVDISYLEWVSINHSDADIVSIAEYWIVERTSEYNKFDTQRERGLTVEEQEALYSVTYEPYEPKATEPQSEEDKHALKVTLYANVLKELSKKEIAEAILLSRGKEEAKEIAETILELAESTESDN